MFTKAQVNRSVANYFSKSRIDPIYSTETKNLKLVYSHKRESLVLLNKHFLTDSCIKLLKTIEKLTNFGILFIILVGAGKRTKVGRILLI